MLYKIRVVLILAGTVHIEPTNNNQNKDKEEKNGVNAN